MNPFTHMVISKDSSRIGIAYTIGTYKECAEYVLRMGIRAFTKIVPF